MSEIRLIDANALKEAIEQWFVKDKYYSNRVRNNIPKSEVFDIIDNAPTVEPIKQCKYCKHCGNEDYCSNCHSDHSLFEYYERPQGEWIKMSDRFGFYFACNKCGYDRAKSDNANFCPNCGADMRGGAE